MFPRALIIIFLTSFLSGCQQSEPTHPLVQEDDVILVDVDGVPITLSMLEHMMEVSEVTEDDEEGMRELLDGLIRRQAIASRAQREGISERDDVRAQRMLQDIEIQYVNYLQQFQLDNPVSDEEIRSVYQSQVERAGDRRYKIETIEFPEQPPALAELEALKAGELTFQEAIDRATADGRIARRTDWIDSTQVPPDFASVLADTGAGDVVETLLPYEGQWLVVRVAEVEAFEPPALDEVREGIRRTLTRQKTEAMIERTYERAEITPRLPLNDADPDSEPGTGGGS